MVETGAYFNLLDWLERRDTLDPQAFLARLQSAYGTGSITYLDAVIASGRLRPQHIHHSQRRDTPLIARSLQRKPALEQLLRIFSALEPIQLVSLHRTEGLDHLILGYPLPALPGRHCCLLVENAATPEEIAAWPAVMIATS